MTGTPVMKARILLQALTFGGDVAEFDEHLSNYFVKTSSFMDIVNDNADLILGEKGTGKSAIFRHLADRQADIPELNDVDIIPAFNIQGSVIFRRLASSPSLPEDAYRFIWFTFIIGLVSNYLLANYESVLDLSRLAKLVDSAGLRVRPPFPLNLWEKIEALVDSISNRLEMEGQLELAMPKLPLKARGTARLRPPGKKEEDSQEQVSLEEILYQCDDHFSQINRRCWVLFDRLDEAFEHNHDLESRALRGLLRAHLDLASYRSRIRSKLFLRSDVMDRVTGSEGFVNATHLRRHRLSWDQDGIIDLIARRIASNPDASEFFHIQPDDVQVASRRIAICKYVLPYLIESMGFIEWIARHTSDATNALNPRNVVGLLRFARNNQLLSYDRDDPDLHRSKPLIDQAALLQGFSDLSKARLEDTVLAEFSSLRTAIEVMRGKELRLRLDELAGYMHSTPNSRNFQATVKSLEYAGVISRRNMDFITIAMLYRPALEVALGRKSALGASEEMSLRSMVDSAITSLLGDGNEITLTELDNVERKYIHHYIANKYPTFNTRSARKNKFGVKNLIIAKPRVVKDPAPRMVATPLRNLVISLRSTLSDSFGQLAVSSPIDSSVRAEILGLRRRSRVSSIPGIVALLTALPDADGQYSSDIRIAVGNYSSKIFKPNKGKAPLDEQQRQQLMDLMMRLCAVAIDENCEAEIQFGLLSTRDEALAYLDGRGDMDFGPPRDSQGSLHREPRVRIAPNTA